MALNDNAMDDLGEPPQDIDLIQQPSPIPKNHQAIVMTPAKNMEGEIMSDEDLAKLPSMDVSFKLVENGQAKIVNLEEVEQEILGQESIGKLSAETASLAFESLFDGPVKLNHFTQTPSQTNYAYVKRHMREQIALEEINVALAMNVFLDQPLEDGYCLYKNINENYIPTLRSDAFYLTAACMAVKKIIDTTKDTVYPMGETFVDLAKVDLIKLDISQVQNLQANTTVLANAVKTLQLAMDDHFFTGFVHAIIQGRGTAYGMTRDAGIEYYGQTLTVGDLIAFYQNMESNACFNYMQEQAEQGLANMQKLQDSGKVDQSSRDSINAFLLEHSETIHDGIKSLHLLTHAIRGMGFMNLAAKALFEFFVKM